MIIGVIGAGRAGRLPGPARRRGAPKLLEVHLEYVPTRRAVAVARPRQRARFIATHALPSPFGSSSTR
jgi:hypothetical protein